MRKVIIKLLIPVILLYLMVGIACNVYFQILRKNVAEDELYRTADLLAEGLYNADLIIKTAMDYHDHAAVVSQNLNFYTDKKEMVDQLVSISKIENVIASMACDADGNGYNSKGEAISLKDEAFFAVAQRDYSRGGSGLIAIDGSGLYDGRSVVLINQVNYKDQVKGFIITVLSVKNFSEKIFNIPYEVDRAALVSLGGVIITEFEAAECYDADKRVTFWEDVPDNLPVDTIKLYISQRNKYIDEIKDYGYAVVAPSLVTQGAAVLLVSEKNMDRVVLKRLAGYRRFEFELFLVLTLFIVVVILIHFLDRKIRFNLAFKPAGGENRDKLTGLYNRQGSIVEINRYVEASDVKNGLIFVLHVDSFSAIRAAEGDNAADNDILQFTRKLMQNYRISDVVGRLSDDEYIIFLKDIAQDKDIRKQVDELQVFLFDMKTDMAKGNKKLNVCVGGAVFPRDGKSAEQLMACANEAMESARLEGRGRISFYK